MTQVQPISIGDIQKVRDAKNLMKSTRKNVIFVKDPDNDYKKILKVSDPIGKNDEDTINTFLSSLQDVHTINENDEVSEALPRLVTYPITLVQNSKNEPVGVISSTDNQRYLDTL